MPAHNNQKHSAKQRVPLNIYDGDILLLLRLKHKLELEQQKPIPINDIFRDALRAFARQHEIISD